MNKTNEPWLYVKKYFTASAAALEHNNIKALGGTGKNLTCYSFYIKHNLCSGFKLLVWSTNLVLLW